MLVFSAIILSFWIDKDTILVVGSMPVQEGRLKTNGKEERPASAILKVYKVALISLIKNKKL